MTKIFEYSSNLAPNFYYCSVCGVKNVKLWRSIVFLATDVELYCVDCAMKKDGNIFDVGNDGKHFNGYYNSDQFMSSLPAIPTEEGSTYWGYTSVPESGCVWWRNLPLRNSK